MTFCLDFLGFRRKQSQQELVKSPKVVGLFGGDIDRHSDPDSMPFIVEWCMQYIETQIILQQENGDCQPYARNIYRIPGSKPAIEELREWFERQEGQNKTRCPPKNVDASYVNAVASLLKLYINTLPRPLVPRQCVKDLDNESILPQRTTDRYITSTGEKMTLQNLLIHLKWISRQPKAMSVEALATVWAPNIFRSMTPQEVVQHIRLTQRLIDSAQDKFINDSEQQKRPRSVENVLEEVKEAPRRRTKTFDSSAEIRRRRRRRMTTAVDIEDRRRAIWRKSSCKEPPKHGELTPVYDKTGHLRKTSAVQPCHSIPMDAIAKVMVPAVLPSRHRTVSVYDNCHYSPASMNSYQSNVTTSSSTVNSSGKDYTSWNSRLRSDERPLAVSLGGPKPPTYICYQGQNSRTPTTVTRRPTHFLRVVIK